MAKCKTCNGSGVIIEDYTPATYVSHDMAMDAGDMELEGSVYTKEEYEYAQCPSCAYSRLDGWQQPASDGGETWEDYDTDSEENEGEY